MQPTNSCIINNKYLFVSLLCCEMVSTATSQQEGYGSDPWVESTVFTLQGVFKVFVYVIASKCSWFKHKSHWARPRTNLVEERKCWIQGKSKLAWLVRVRKKIDQNMVEAINGSN